MYFFNSTGNNLFSEQKGHRKRNKEATVIQRDGHLPFSPKMLTFTNTWAIPTEILIWVRPALLDFWPHQCSDSQRALFPLAEATPFHYKTTVTANTCSPDMTSEEETISHQVRNALPCLEHVTWGSLVCVAPPLTEYESHIASGFSFHHLKWSGTSPHLFFPPSCPCFLTQKAE